MSNTLNRLKGLMVAARESLDTGNRETASNLMETMLDEMETVSAEDIEINLQVVDDVPAEHAADAAADLDLSVEFDDNDDEDAEETASSEESSLYGLVNSLRTQAKAS